MPYDRPRMAQKTTVAIRFTTELNDARKTGFVNELSKLIVYKLKQARPKPDEEKDFTQQWFRLPNEENIFCVAIWGKHETVEVRKVVSEIAEECARDHRPVVLDIIME